MKGIGKGVVKLRIPILIISILLLIPAAIFFIRTRVNYDVLTYLPKQLETMKGQEILVDEFGTGAFTFLTVEGMDNKDISRLKSQIENVDHVKKVLWYDTLLDISVPEEMLPDEVREAFKTDDADLMLILFDTTISADETLEAVGDIRKVTNEQCFLSGMSAVVLDTKELSDREVPIYVGIAVVLSLIVLSLTMDSFLIPVFFLLSIGMAIIYNLGSNVIQGEISYITLALTAVLQLAVTMDYSIFLWHSYTHQRRKGLDKEEAMAEAINGTLVSVIGSSVTTVAGFVALCFMSFTLGLDLGVVMAKGVVIGVIACVTILPSFILTFNGAIERTAHRPLLPSFKKLAGFITDKYPIFIIIFLIILVPAFYGYRHTGVYYKLDASLPDYLPSIEAGDKRNEYFEMNSTHIILLDRDLSRKDTRSMIKDIKNVSGVKTVLGLDSVLGPSFPEEMLPDDLLSNIESDNYKLLMVMSEYEVATDEVNAQCEDLESIIKSYDPSGMLIGEAPCTKDLIRTTAVDFRNVSIVSIGLVLLIIGLVFKSVSVPVILVAAIEFAIFINMGIPYYTGSTLPFIASIVIGTIQLGSTVDYAILMTNNYKDKRAQGEDKKTSIRIALEKSIQSIVVSALTFFAATIGVGIYSEIDMIGSLCILMARGAIISMFTVIFIVPALLMVFDGLIIHTSAGFKAAKGKLSRHEDREVLS